MIRTGEILEHRRFGVGIATSDEFTGTNGKQQIMVQTTADDRIHAFQVSSLLRLPVNGKPEDQPAIGSTRACPDCGRSQHYTGTENGWAHDAIIATWECNDPAKTIIHDCGNAAQCWCGA